MSRIVAEAQREGVALSEVERKMLYFSETAWTLPDIMEVNDVSESEYDTEEYEEKIGGLARAFRERVRKDDRNEFEAWNVAIGRLRREDHYILVMVDLPEPLSRRLLTRDGLRLVLTAFICVCILIVIVIAVEKIKSLM